MNPWLETAGIIVLTFLGILVGRAFSNLRNGWWMLGYFLSFVLIAILVATRFADALIFMPPFCWLTAGRIKFVILSLAVTTGLMSPFSRLPYKFEKVTICILMAVILVWFSVFPFLVPAVLKGYLSNLQTVVDAEGICFQTEEYTCGPAAAVTALRKLGLAAQEGEIAVLSHTSPITGTLPRCLYLALQNRYKAEGLKCRYRRFESVAQLGNAGITLAVVKDAFLTDHCVAVLEVSEDSVTIADPVVGKLLMSHQQFEEIWRFSGIVLQRNSAEKI